MSDVLTSHLDPWFDRPRQSSGAWRRFVVGLPLGVPVAGAVHGWSGGDPASVGLVVAIQVSIVAWVALRGTHLVDALCRSLSKPTDAVYVVVALGLTSLTSFMSEPRLAMVMLLAVIALLVGRRGSRPAMAAWTSVAGLLSLITAVLLMWIVGILLVPVTIAAWRSVIWQWRGR